MKKHYLLLTLFFEFFVLNATVYIVNFGTHYGNNYIPNSMIINLGDTVKFSGTFALLPLTSTILPSGAITFSNNLGGDYMYIPNVLGTHNYTCTADSTMIGSFYVQSNVGLQDLSQQTIKCNYNPISEIIIENLENEDFTYSLYTASGSLIMEGKNDKILNLSNKNVKNMIIYLQIRKKQLIFTNKIFIN